MVGGGVEGCLDLGVVEENGGGAVVVYVCGEDDGDVEGVGAVREGVAAHVREGVVVDFDVGDGRWAGFRDGVGG